jgi:hypothetical protein
MNVTSENDEAQVVLFAEQYSERELNQVFQRAFDSYPEDDDERREQNLEDLTTFARWTFEGPDKWEQLREEKKISSPCATAALCSMVACGIRKHPYFNEALFDKIQLIADLKEMYGHLMGAIISDFDADFHLKIFNEFYQKEIDKNHPHPAWTAKAIVSHEDAHPEFNRFIEIPLSAASEICMARWHGGNPVSSYDPETKSAIENTNYHIRNNNIYVPVAHAERLVSEQIMDNFYEVAEFAWEVFDDGEHETIFNEVTSIQDRVEDLLNHGEEERLWTDWDPQQNLIRLVRNAAKADNNLNPTEWHTAAEYYKAVEKYEADGFGETNAKSGVKNARSLSSKLRELAESNEYSTVDVTRYSSGQDNTYTVGTKTRGAREIAVNSLDDIFQLPCFQNMREALKLENSGPVRKDLFNFVRMVFWLKGYHELPEQEREDAVVEDIHQLFEDTWDWYDPAETEYQSRYEIREGEINGEIPLPMHCDNSDMQRHCIGQNLCPYSIYGSLPFPDEMYDRLPDDDI